MMNENLKIREFCADDFFMDIVPIKRLYNNGFKNKIKIKTPDGNKRDILEVSRKLRKMEKEIFYSWRVYFFFSFDNISKSESLNDRKHMEKILYDLLNFMHTGITPTEDNKIKTFKKINLYKRIKIKPQHEKITENNLKNISQKLVNLPPRKIDILIKIAKEKDMMTTDELANSLNKKRSQISQDLNYLFNKKLVTKHRQGMKMYYDISPQMESVLELMHLI